MGWHISAFVIVSVVLILGIVSLWTMKELLRLANKEKEADIALTRLEENKTLIDTLKASQHDFANHLQVIFGLIHQNRKEEARKYMQNITEDLKAVDRVTGIKRPEVAALICKKMTLTKGAVIEPVVETTLADLAVPPDKTVSILSNLLDNAIYEVENKPLGSSRITLKVGEEAGRYFFEIANPGCIPLEVQKEMFTPGFTTKGDAGSGMGLYIVKSTVERNGGSLEYASNDETGTVFKVFLPKEDKKEVSDVG